MPGYEFKNIANLHGRRHHSLRVDGWWDGVVGGKNVRMMGDGAGIDM